MARSLSVAVVTMLRDDPDFFAVWRRYYGGLFGARSLHVVVDGDGDAARARAEGCQVIGLPGGPHRKFDARRWRFLNHLVQGLRIYHDRVIVGDVDELVVADPAQGPLPERLASMPRVAAITPLGLELVHRPAEEPAPPGPPVIGPRRHVRLAPLYAKPCIVGGPVRLSRGGHYADCPDLTQPEGLYLLHLKHMDRTLYARAMDRRNAVAAATGAARPQDAMIGRHWFAQARDDAATFADIDRATVADIFDMAPAHAAFAAAWRPRPGTPFWESVPPHDPALYRLPERFVGIA